MVHAYYMQDPVLNQRDPCELTPFLAATSDDLSKVGVWTKQIPIEDGWEEKLDEIAEEHDLAHRDEVIINKERLPNYEEKIKMFFEEHLHVDPEVRFVRDGRGYFDLRDPNDRWIRIAVEKGDLLFLPAGIYHRFTVDNSDYIHAVRLFKDVPKWEAFNRNSETDHMDARKEFMNAIH